MFLCENIDTVPQSYDQYGWRGINVFSAEVKKKHEGLPSPSTPTRELNELIYYSNSVS